MNIGIMGMSNRRTTPGGGCRTKKEGDSHEY